MSYLITGVVYKINVPARARNRLQTFGGRFTDFAGRMKAPRQRPGDRGLRRLDRGRDRRHAAQGGEPGRLTEDRRPSHSLPRERQGRSDRHCPA